MTEEEFSSIIEDGNGLVKKANKAMFSGVVLTLLALSGVIGIIMLLLGYTHFIFYLMPFVALSIPFIEVIIKTADVIITRHKIKKLMYSAKIIFDITNQKHKEDKV